MPCEPFWEESCFSFFLFVFNPEKLLSGVFVTGVADSDYADHMKRYGESHPEKSCLKIISGIL